MNDAPLSSFAQHCNRHPVGEKRKEEDLFLLFLPLLFPFSPGPDLLLLSRHTFLCSTKFRTCLFYFSRNFAGFSKKELCFFLRVIFLRFTGFDMAHRSSSMRNHRARSRSRSPPRRDRDRSSGHRSSGLRLSARPPVSSGMHDPVMESRIRNLEEELRFFRSQAASR